MQNHFLESFYKIPSPVVLSVKGKDAERYLQARLTNDIRKLVEGSAMLAACLTPQGKTKALFRIYKVSNLEFLLIALGGDAAQILREFSCFIVADQVEVVDVSTVNPLFLVTPDVSLKTASLHFPDSYLGFNFLLGSLDSLSNLTSLTKKDFDSYRMKNSLPEFPEEVRVDSLFPEAEIALAISNTKGCYAGQEVVERVIALGKVPARLTACFATVDSKATDNLLIQDGQGNKAGDVLTYELQDDGLVIYLMARIATKFQGEKLFLNNGGVNSPLSFVEKVR
jgi:folate-binding protein YgfZ